MASTYRPSTRKACFAFVPPYTAIAAVCLVTTGAPVFAVTQYDWAVAPGSVAALEDPANYLLFSSGDMIIPTTPPDSTTAIAFNNVNVTNTRMLTNGNDNLDSILAQAGQNSIDFQNHALSLNNLSLTGSDSAAHSTLSDQRVNEREQCGCKYLFRSRFFQQHNHRAIDHDHGHI